MNNKSSAKRVTAPTTLQYEAVECGAASLSTILNYYGRIVSLSELRKACGVNRDGSNAKQILKAARQYGLEAEAYRFSSQELSKSEEFPCIIFWGFNHFLVIEGFDNEDVYLSDPAQGRIKVHYDEFLDNFTGIVLTFKPSNSFIKGGRKQSPLFEISKTLYPYLNPLTKLLLISTILTIPTILAAGLSSTFIDQFLRNQRLYLGLPILWILLITSIVWLVLLSIQFILLRRLEYRLSKSITSDLFIKLFKAPYSFHQSRFEGELANRMVLGLSITQVLVGQVVRFISSIWRASIILFISFFVSKVLALLVSTVLILNLSFNWWLTAKRSDSNRKLSIDTGKAFAKGLMGISNLENLKASGLEFDFLSQWQASFGNVVKGNQKLGSKIALSTVSASASNYLLNALIICLAGLLIISGDITLGTLIAFQFLQSQIVEPISSLPTLTSSIQRLIGELGRLQDLNETGIDPYVRSFSIEDSELVDSQKTTKLTGEIVLENLSFNWDNTTNSFITGINIRIEPGSLVSIVGGSGSGKTTLIRLLAGFYTPTHGKILFDGKTWLEHDDLMIRNSLAYVPQRVFIFNASIKDNITLWNSTYQLPDIRSAAYESCVHELIESHPESYDRVLKDNGSDLSGGERQRLEICRAIVRKPSILLFDEATSALDSKTQNIVINNLRKKGITIINVAHRLETALISDQVLVMEKGHQVELGTPKYLLSKGGIFSSLIQSDLNKSNT